VADPKARLPENRPERLFSGDGGRPRLAARCGAGQKKAAPEGAAVH
jgi:hypothetical protein